MCVCLCVCIHVCVCVCVYVCIHVCVSVCACMCMVCVPTSKGSINCSYEMKLCYCIMKLNDPVLQLCSLLLLHFPSILLMGVLVVTKHVRRRSNAVFTIVSLEVLFQDFKMSKVEHFICKGQWARTY